MNATGYVVSRATAGSGPFTQVASPTSTTFTDTSVATGNTYYYEVSATNSAGSSSPSAAVPVSLAAADVVISVNAGSTHPISPYIYGINADAVYAPTVVPAASVTFNRIGGNRWTAYNWQNNYSNAGSDYLYENDQYLDSSTVPAHAVTSRIAADRTGHRATLMTVPMQGYVSADAAGPVTTNGTSVDTSRFKTLQFSKGASFSSTPSNANPSVYDDEFLWAVDKAFPGQGIFTANPVSYPVFVELDNEPDDWAGTHAEIQTSTEISSSAFLAKSVSLAKALKTVFPGVRIWGPANASFASIYWWDSTTFKPDPNIFTPQFDWWADAYLAAFQSASTAYGMPLLDAFSMHWYSHVNNPDSSGNDISGSTTGATLSPAAVQAVVQSPRSLWDPSFVENSWITQDVGTLNGVGNNDSLQMIPRMLAKLKHSGATNNLAFTEYFNGGNNHIAGLIAQADNLGVFGAQGLYAANLWPIGPAPYPLGAFSAFRNFDGKGGNFGDTSLTTTSTSTASVVAYVSTDSSSPGRTVVVAINRSVIAQSTAITGAPLSGTATVYRITADSAATQPAITPVLVTSQPVSSGTLTLTLPPLSVTTVNIQ